MEEEAIDQKIKEAEQYQRDLEIMAKYDKADKIISSDEAQALAEEDRKKPSIMTNINQIDEMIGGFRESQVVIVSGPTGHGKTTFCRTLTRRFAEQNVNCLWMSYEEGIGEFLNKFVDVPLFYLPQELKQGSLEWTEERIVESIAKYDCKVIFIDHLHYLLEMQKMAEAKSLSLLIGMMLREIKKMAIKHQVTIFLVSHMKKIMYDRMPEIDDLRDSSFVGQEADVVMFVKRQQVDNKLTDFSTVLIAKNRRTGNLGPIENFKLEGGDLIHDETHNTNKEVEGTGEENYAF